MVAIRWLVMMGIALPLQPAPTLDEVAAEAAATWEKACVVTGSSAAGKRRFSRHGKASGVAAREMIFEIGSISKVFTGLLLALAVEEGKVRYDSTVAELSGLDCKDPRVGEITLRQLATHTSGLPRLPDNHDFDASGDPYAGYGRAELDAFLVAARLKGDPPYDAAYSNLGFGLLGDLLARSWGQPWGKLIEDKISGPLELEDTTQVLSREQERRLAPPRFEDQPGSRWSFEALAGAGALHSTAEDLVRFGEAILHPEKTPLEEPLREVITVHSEAHGLGGPIGLGMMIGTLHGQPEFSHSGGTGGYRSRIQILPKEGLVQVVLANNSSVDPASIIAASHARPEGKRREVIPLKEAQLDRFVGIYRMNPESRFTVLRRGDHLVAQLTGQAFLPLDALTPRRFRYRSVDAELLFSEEGGAVTQLTLFQNGREIPVKRSAGKLPPVRFPKAGELKEYAGRYTLAPGKVIEVTRRGDTLFAQLTGQPAFPVFQTEDDRFIYFVVEAALEFERGPSGKVAGLVLDQNGRHRAAREE